MTITYVIPGTTLLDQLNPTTLDGLPNNDGADNCVGASVAEALHILTGKTYDGDEVKDSAYGASYTGFESAAHYVNYADTQGVLLQPHDGTQANLIATIHAEVGRGNPVIVTMPSMWGTAPADPVHPSGTTHVGVAVGIGPNEIRVMNPWHGFYQDQPDSWWQARLCYGQVWLCWRKPAPTPTPTPPAPTGGTTAMWHTVDANTVADSRGVKAHFAMANYLRAHTALGDVVQGFPGEQYYDANNSFIPLEGDTVLWWNKQRGSVLEAGGEVAAALYNELNSVRTQLTATINNLQAKLASQQELSPAAVNALKADIAQLQATVASLSQLEQQG